LQPQHPTDIHPQEAHRAAAIQAGDRAGEVDFIALVLAGIAGIAVPEQEPHGHGQHHQDEGADGDVIGFSLHGVQWLSVPVPVAARAAQARGSWKYSLINGWALSTMPARVSTTFFLSTSTAMRLQVAIS